MDVELGRGSVIMPRAGHHLSFSLVLWTVSSSDFILRLVYGAGEAAQAKIVVPFLNFYSTLFCT